MWGTHSRDSADVNITFFHRLYSVKLRGYPEQKCTTPYYNFPLTNILLFLHNFIYFKLVTIRIHLFCVNRYMIGASISDAKLQCSSNWKFLKTDENERKIFSIILQLHLFWDCKHNTTQLNKNRSITKWEDNKLQCKPQIGLILKCMPIKEKTKHLRSWTR